MKIVHWLLLVSVALFVSGIWLVVAGASAARQRPAAPVAAAPVLTPIATVKQIMNGIVDPAATVIFGSVGANISDKGIEEIAPKNDKEWDAVGTSAAALIESGNLMLMGNRMVDTAEWVTMSQAMIDSGKSVMEAVRAKSADGVLAAGEAVYLSCDNCHRKYQRTS